MSPARCCECQRLIDPHHPDVHHEMLGWTKPRRRVSGKAAQGGQNSISFTRATGRFMCARCYQQLRDTGVARQETLL